jgi:folate-binding protein YgfZ
MSDAITAARASAAWFPLAQRAVLEVRGSDRVRFLQGQLTNDVAALDATGPIATSYGLALTREGRIVADFHVIARADAIWLDVERAVAPAAIERLSKYVVADDVEIADASAAFARFAIEGPRARDLLAAAGAAAIGAGQVAETRFAGARAIAAGFALAGRTGIQLFAPRDAADAIGSALRATDAVEGDAAALEVLRVEAGLPRAGAEIGLDTLPAELDLVERAVSFTKGCFTGQEVVTRMHSRGRVGHRLVGVALGERTSLPAPHAAVEIAGAKVGEVTSAVRSPSAGAIALAIVRRGSEAPGAEAHVDDAGARVVSLPFVPIPDAS